MKKFLALLFGLAVIATACGDDSEAEAAPAVVVDAGANDQDDSEQAAGTDDAGAESTSAGGSDEELALAFAQCMRDNGVDDFEDPTVEADGSISLLGDGGPGGRGNVDPSDPAVQDALEQCGDLVAGASFLPGANLSDAELEDNLLAFAGCLRDLGYDVDDPDLSGGFNPGADGGPAAIFGDSFDLTDPANADAVQECQSVFGADGPFAGGGN